VRVPGTHKKGDPLIVKKNNGGIPIARFGNFIKIHPSQRFRQWRTDLTHSGNSAG